MIVGSRLLLTVTITDKASGVLVDPASLTFRLKPPSTYSAPVGVYAWDGTAWTNSEATIAVPAKGATGLFTLEITVPYDNTAGGSWYVGWKHAENVSGLGEGSGDTRIVITASAAL